MARRRRDGARRADGPPTACGAGRPVSRSHPSGRSIYACMFPTKETPSDGVPRVVCRVRVRDPRRDGRRGSGPTGRTPSGVRFEPRTRVRDEAGSLRRTGIPREASAVRRPNVTEGATEGTTRHRRPGDESRPRGVDTRYRTCAARRSASHSTVSFTTSSHSGHSANAPTDPSRLSYSISVYAGGSSLRQWGHLLGTDRFMLVGGEPRSA